MTRRARMASLWKRSERIRYERLWTVPIHPMPITPTPMLWTATTFSCFKSFPCGAAIVVAGPALRKSLQGAAEGGDRPRGERVRVAALLLPERDTVKVPVSGPASAALASVAWMLTVGGSSAMVTVALVGEMRQRRRGWTGLGLLTRAERLDLV